ncbi:hypothetical protein FRC18_004738 [Serendipita sp. 400]|nr:hypothetical protein FRC18_004738 [Serendipita sp. 400]
MVSWNSLLVTCLAVAGVYAGAVKRDTTVTSSPSSSSITPPVVSTSSSNCAPRYAQCGGVGFTGPTCCQSGSTCTYSNSYFSTCVLDTLPTTTTSSASPPPASSSSSARTSSVICTNLWGQCGGQAFTGPTCCPAGWTCVYINIWFSQCLRLATTITATL